MARIEAERRSAGGGSGLEFGVASGQWSVYRVKKAEAGRYKTVARRWGFLWDTVSRRFVGVNGTRGGAGRGIARAACAEAVTRHFCETQGVCGGENSGAAVGAATWFLWLRRSGWWNETCGSVVFDKKSPRGARGGLFMCFGRVSSLRQFLYCALGAFSPEGGFLLCFVFFYPR